MIKLSTPSNVNDLSREEVLKLVKPVAGMPSARNRATLYDAFMKAWGLTLTNDVLLTLLSEEMAQLVIATAGSGKTTLAIGKIIGVKLFRKNKEGKPIRGNRILYLIYNKENTKDVQHRHLKFLNRLANAGFADNVNIVSDLDLVPPAKRGSGIYLDTQLKISTMHAFCEEWRKEYAAKLNMLGMVALTDEESNSIMGNSAKLMLEKHNIASKTATAQALKSLYNLTKESMCEVEDLKNHDMFREINLPVDVICDIFTRYEKSKQTRKKYDFTDMLVKFYELLKTDAGALERIRARFDYIIADEYQDFTPIMSHILELIAKDNTPLLCVGDEDQNLYSFRGSDINNILEFTKRFPDAPVLSLQYNRRCAKSIFDLSKRVIEQNVLRFDKSLVCANSNEGLVEFIPYTSAEGQAMRIVQELKKFPSADLDDTYICYRERASSMILAELLGDAEIPVHVLSGYAPFSHELYKHVAEILLALSAPNDIGMTMKLYKVLPVSKAAWYADLGYDQKTGRFIRERDENGENLMFMHFMKRKYLKCSHISGFDEAMHNLHKISQMINTAPMNQYFSVLFNQLLKYFWKFKAQVTPNPADTFFEKRVYGFFNSNRTYPEVIANYEAKLKRVQAQQANSVGVALATFHKLKGLEYKHGFIIDMDESIFPNFSLIDSREYPSDVKERLKESETRLFFVAITRAKETLRIMYNETNPSRYVRYELSGNNSIIPKNVYKLTDITSDSLTVAELALEPDLEECILGDPEITEVPASSDSQLIGAELEPLDHLFEDDLEELCLPGPVEVKLPVDSGDSALQTELDNMSIAGGSEAHAIETKTEPLIANNAPGSTESSFLRSVLGRLR